jgi:hypothetical protein
VIVWIAVIALYPILGALYLGGAAINIEGGGAGRQTAGLILHYAAFIGAYTVLRLVMTTFIGPVLAVGLALVGAAILLPLLARLTFRVVGVRITSADPATGRGVA